MMETWEPEGGENDVMMLVVGMGDGGSDRTSQGMEEWVACSFIDHLWDEHAFLLIQTRGNIDCYE